MSSPRDVARVGILGGGQLGRMLALAGYPLGVECTLLDPGPDACARQVAPTLEGALDSVSALTRLARGVDVLTFDIENVPAEALGALRDVVPIHPAPAAIATAQDRLAEKSLFESLGIASTPFVPVQTRDDLGRAAARLGWPLVLKARRLGYDGRGQRTARSIEELERGWAELGQVPAIAEAWIAFEREVSLIAACGSSGELAFYPLAENVHDQGILRYTIAPFLDRTLQAQAEHWLASISRHFDYRGVLTVEFFVTANGLIANEIAPRVHNSGHWTIEGAETSQFENHLRAVLGWPLGDPRPRGHAAMLNLLGALPPLASVLAIEGAHLHRYGKDAKPRRKLGHCTITDVDRTRLLTRFDGLRARLAL
jgi:5-(carboxyamino)imidazole ribonucleotide synthase